MWNHYNNLDEHFDEHFDEHNLDDSSPPHSSKPDSSVHVSGRDELRAWLHLITMRNPPNCLV